MISLQPILLTAATRFEAQPLARQLGLVADGAGRFVGSIAGRSIVLVVSGIGPVRTAIALERGFSASDFGLALSVGLCGALQDGLHTGELIADAEDIAPGYVEPLRAAAWTLGLPCHFGRILHTNVVLQPADKRALGSAHGALACDMETAAVRRWSGGATAVLGARVVLDELGQTLPADAPADGDLLDLTRYALSRAGHLPRLLQVGWRSARAMRNLAQVLRLYLATV